MTAGPPSPASEPFPRGHRLLGRYELIGELARGGMGTVYLARNAGEGRFQRLFAIKVMHPHLAADTAFIDMLSDEAQFAARLHHPNVVPIIDLGKEGDLHYVVMEYIEGPALSTLLKRSPEYRPPELVVAIIIDALDGIHAAHTLQDDEGKEIRLVHRDVSPPNILVGSDGIGRITDFGIAKAEARISSTRPGMRKGKLQYMSPEQIRDGDAVDHRTDIWAIGAVLWNALTGRNLFKGESDGATIHNIIEKAITPPSSEGLNPPSCFDPIVMRALSRDPVNRYASALEMADALRLTAAGNGLAGSKHQVARWVADVFGNELEQRRKAIREVSQRRIEVHDSQTNAVVPRTSILRPLASGAITLTQLSHIPSFGIEPTPGSSSAPPPPVQEIPIDAPDFRQNKTRLWLALGVGVALVAIVVMALQSSNDEPIRDHEARAATSVADIPTSPVEPAQSAETRAVPTNPAHREAESTARAPAADEKKDVGKAAQQKRVLAPSTEQPAREAKPVTKETAAPAPKSAPSPTPTDDFEKNPYLRR